MFYNLSSPCSQSKLLQMGEKKNSKQLNLLFFLLTTRVSSRFIEVAIRFVQQYLFSL